jgi:hypothetical protein
MPLRRAFGRIGIVAIVALASGVALDELRASAEQVLRQPADVDRSEPRPRPIGTSQLSGVVTETNGAPVTGVSVNFSSQLSFLYRTTTDAAGRYELTNLPAGRYSVQVLKTGYLLSTSTHKDIPSFEELPLELGEGARIRVDFKMARAGTIEGRVYDEQGEPVLKARVTLFRRSVVGGFARLISLRSAETDDTGHYRFDGLDPREYLVAAQAPLSGAFRTRHLPDAVYGRTFYPNASSANGAQLARTTLVAPEFTADIRLRPVPAMEFGGTVLDVQGQAMRSGTLTVLDPATTGHTAEASVSLGRDGTFRFRGLPAGTYLLRVLAQCCAGERRAFGYATVTPGDASRNDIRIMMVPEVQISGRVFGLPGATATVEARTRYPAVIPDASARPDAEGRFEFKAAPVPARLDVSGLPPGWYVSSVRTRTGPLMDGKFDASSGVDLNDVEITVSNNIGHVRGAVSGVRGVAAERTIVTLFVLGEPDGAFGLRTNYQRTASLDAEGRFELKDVPPGDYRIAALRDVPRTLVEDPEFLTVVARQGSSVTVFPAGSSDVTLLPMTP